MLDGNVYRVLARLFGLHADIAAPSSRKEFQAAGRPAHPSYRTGRFQPGHYGVWGHSVHSRQARLLVLPLAEAHAGHFQHGQVALLPVKSKAKASRTRYFHYFVLRHGEHTYLRERREKDIWQGLYDFAMAETTVPELPPAELLRHLDALGAALDTSQAAEPTAAYRHVLSHQKLEARFHPLALARALPAATLRDLGLRAYSADEIEALPKPKLIANYCSQNL